MKSCILISHMPNPRFLKRIEVLCSVTETMLICVRREKTELWSNFDSKDVKSEVIDLDIPTLKHFIKRILSTERFKRIALDKLRDFQPDIIYLEGLDCLLIATRYAQERKEVKIYYEIGDLRAGIHDKCLSFHKQLINLFATIVEKRKMMYIYKIVVTSKRFYIDYYKNFFEKERCIYIPNIPDLSVFDSYVKKSEGKFTIGFIGAVRYADQMKMLIDATEDMDVNVFFAGGAHENGIMDELKSYACNHNNVSFLGAYDYKTEISDLYAKADCIYSVYDVDGKNARIALPNKLYESIICGLPIIVAKGTYLGELVDEWGCGMLVSYNDTSELKNVIQQLKKEDIYNAIVQNCIEKAYELRKYDTKNLLADDIKQLE